MAEGLFWELHDDNPGDWTAFAVWRRTFELAPEFFAAAPLQLVAGLLRRMFAGAEMVDDEEFFLHCLSRAPPFWNGGVFVLSQPWGPPTTGAQAIWQISIAICRHCMSATSVLRALAELERRGAPVAQIAEALTQPSSDAELIAAVADGLHPTRGFLDKWVPKKIRSKLLDYVPSTTLDEISVWWKQESFEWRGPGEDAEALVWASRRARACVHWRGIRSAWASAVARARPRA